MNMKKRGSDNPRFVIGLIFLQPSSCSWTVILVVGVEYLLGARQLEGVFVEVLVGQFLQVAIVMKLLEFLVHCLSQLLIGWAFVKEEVGAL